MPPARPKLAWAVPDLSHYHVPRIAAFARLGTAEVHVLELSDTSGFAEFRHPGGGNDWGGQVHTLFSGEFYINIPRAAIRERILAALDDLAPDVVLVQGWAEPFALGMLEWACARGRPAVVTSESTAWDAPRRPVREWIKARIVRLFAAGVVGGQAHRAYLQTLGMRADQIFEGYDAVDNRYFAEGAAAARADEAALRRVHGMPARYFLASNRFVEKKNLLRLLDAYTAYRQEAGADAWSLVLLGDGVMRGKLEAHRRALGLESSVLMPGFKSYAELPVWYALAGAFVHASTTEQWGLVVNEAMASGLPVLVSNRCGCVPDLVAENVNGWTFDPLDVPALAAALRRMAAFSEEERAAMGRAGVERIAAWSPDRFAAGLQRATEIALAAPPAGGGNRLDRAGLRFLAARA